MMVWVESNKRVVKCDMGPGGGVRQGGCLQSTPNESGHLLLSALDFTRVWQAEELVHNVSCVTISPVDVCYCIQRNCVMVRSPLSSTGWDFFFFPWQNNPLPFDCRGYEHNPEKWSPSFMKTNVKQFYHVTMFLKYLKDLRCHMKHGH